MPFESNLDTRYMGKGKSKLLADLDYAIPGTNNIIRVQAGFITDFASIPRVFRTIVTGQDNSKKPAVIHDYLYSIKRHSRKWCDQMFLSGMKDEGVSWWKRTVYYSGIRAGGWMVWHGNKSA